MMASGVIFLDKPLGWTSRRAVNEVMRVFSVPGKKRIKAGHAGTLDPLATGMLPILLGDATRFAELGLHAEKRYSVTFDLSYQTDTLDCEGEACKRFDTQPNKQQLMDVLDLFQGEIQQVPPIYSAIRVDGKRSHAMAREGKAVELAARTVCIHALDLLAFEYPLVSLDVRCSKGTYIRSLARDIGKKLGVGGCVTALRRTSTGGWPASMMVAAECLEHDKEQAVLPLRQWLRDFPTCELTKEDAWRFLNGQRIQLECGQQGSVAVMCDECLLGTAELKQGMRRMVLHPLRILPSSQQHFASKGG
ncbi:MAG: tRNA pseudouridine(55) synthase TruB [Mariprofundaceae bacterium]|nr:tRNA pseudouridine(55) synthase TruB [Mariprofundaceae bacterium]